MNSFTLENAKTVFDLLKEVSPYAMPLLISLIFPIIWIIFKKILGISKKAESKMNDNENNTFSRIFERFKRIFNSLSGDVGDRVVFYSCLFLFLAGCFFLKYGERQEEIIRQKGIELRMYFEAGSSLSEDIKELELLGFDKDLIDDIRFKYPNQFVAFWDDDNHQILGLVDTTSVNKIKKSIFSLIDSFLITEFQKKDEVDISFLMKKYRDKPMSRIGQWHLEYYLAEKLDKKKYSLEDNGKTTFIKRIVATKTSDVAD